MQQMKAAAANFHCDKLTNFPQIFLQSTDGHIIKFSWENMAAFEGNIVQL